MNKFHLRFLISISAQDQKRYPFDHSSAWRISLNVQSVHVKSDGKRTSKFWAVTSARTNSEPPTDGVKSKTGRSRWSNNCNLNPPWNQFQNPDSIWLIHHLNFPHCFSFCLLFLSSNIKHRTYYCRNHYSRCLDHRISFVIIFEQN